MATTRKAVKQPVKKLQPKKVPPTPDQFLDQKFEEMKDLIKGHIIRQREASKKLRDANLLMDRLHEIYGSQNVDICYKELDANMGGEKSVISK